MRQWARLLAGLLVATGLASGLSLFWRADLSLYDATLPSQPAPDDVVIIAIDDASIAELGRWPWPRTLHARLMDRLTALQARAVAFDILFTEPDATDPAADAALAAAIARGPPTVLPLAVEMPAAGRGMRVLQPIPALTGVAAAIGHVHLELDRDGVGRSVFLSEGAGRANYPHLMFALLDHAPGESHPSMRGARHPGPVTSNLAWIRDYQMFIPFRGPPGHFMRLSYADVLEGRVAPGALRGKLVLVGLTAQGTGDAYPTPRSGLGVAMPGVEISANVLEALRSGPVVRPLGRTANVLLALFPLVIVALAFLRLTPRSSLIFAGIAWLVTLFTSVVLLRVAGLWWPPTAPLAALLVFYPLWSWRRLEATQSYLDEELARLSQEPFPFIGPAPPAGAGAAFTDSVERRIAIVRDAIQRSRDARRLFSDTIKALPGATFLTDNNGRVVIANRSAAQIFGLDDESALEDAALDDFLAARSGDATLSFAQLARHAPGAREAALPGGRSVLVRTVPFSDSTAQRVGTLIEVNDISELRAAQREREDALRFLSHDMKSPASSLLGLAQLQRDPARALPPASLAQRLELLAQRLLALVDGFVGLARAEAMDPGAFSDFDLRDALQDALDEVWAVAQSRSVTLDAPMPGDAMVVRGDRSLLARALINLLGNALKFAPRESAVGVRCRVAGAEVAIDVEDRGPGIPEEAHGALFQRFTRRLHRGDADPGGAGLGLAFVRVVLEKHGGRAWMENAGSSGAIFSVALPLSQAATTT